VVDPEKAKKFATERFHQLSDVMMLDKDWIELVYNDLMSLATDNKLNSLERPK